MHPAFKEAAIGGSHQIYGYKLLPLSCAHLLMLECVGSPVFSGQPFSAEDLHFAAKVCSSPVRMVHGAYLPDVTWKATVREKWHLARSCANPKHLTRQLAAFRAYLDDYMAEPEKYDTPNRQPRPLSSPVLFALATRAVPLFGEERAWTMPYGLLRAYLDVHTELEGGTIRFVPSPEEMEEIRKQDEEADRVGAEILARIRKQQEVN